MRHLSDHDETELATLGHFSDDYGDEPIFKCQNCASKNPGYEEKEASLLTVIAAVLCLLIFRLYSFLILPLVVESTKTIIKKCVKCDHVLDKQELLSMPSLTDKILSFKCGGCAIVISRKYALVIIAILSLIWFFIPSHETTVINPGGLTLTKPWEEYVEDCGRKVVLSNQVRAKRSFDNKYANNIVEWEGVVHKKYDRNEIHNNPFIGYILLVKMNPSDSKTEFSDIQLDFSNSQAAKYGKTLELLKEGDVLGFKGVLRAMGDEFRFHELEVISINPTGRHIDIASIPMISYVGNASNMRKGKAEEIDSTPQSASATHKKVEKTAKKTEETSEKPQDTQDTQTSQTNTDNTVNEPASNDNQNPQVDDQTAPVDDQTAPVDDQTAPVDDQTAPVDDQTVPADDQTAPVDDQTAPVDDQTTQTGQTNDQINNIDEPGQVDVGSVDDQGTQTQDQDEPNEPGQVDEPVIDDNVQGDEPVVDDNVQGDEPVIDDNVQQGDKGTNDAGDA